MRENPFEYKLCICISVAPTNLNARPDGRERFFKRSDIFRAWLQQSNEPKLSNTEQGKQPILILLANIQIYYNLRVITPTFI